MTSAPRISLLEADPELLAHISEAEAGRARRSVTAPLVVLAEGSFDPAAVLAAGRRAFGALVVGGLVNREVSVGGQSTLKLLGPGDVVHERALPAGMLEGAQAWSASVPTRLALLDDQFLQAVRHWPRLVTALVERANERHDATLLQMAISQAPRVEDRLAGLFALLAERWGRVTPHGVAVPLALTHEALARLIGARRPTVTLALRALSDDGRLARIPEGGWLVFSDVGQEAVSLQPLVGTSRPRPLPAPEGAPTVAGHDARSLRRSIERARKRADG